MVQNNMEVNSKKDYIALTKRNSVLNKFIRQRMLFLLLLPGIIVLIVFAYTPTIGLLMAFIKYRVQDGFFGSEFVGLMYFKKFLTDPGFYNALKNTFCISVLSILFGFPAPIILALMVDDIKNIYVKKFSQTITYLPHFISWVIIATLAYRLLDRDGGIINAVLEFFGQDRIAFLHNPDYFWTILIFIAVWKEIGWNSIIYLAAISNIDQELYNAAMVDGASKFKQKIHITIPGIMPTAALLLVLSLGTLVSVNFDAVFNLSNPLVLPAAEVIDTYIFRTGIQYGEYSYATAIGLSQSLISFMLVVLGLKIAKKFNNYSII